MHIELCIVLTKSTTKLKFLILRTGNKRMTRTDITRPFLSKSAEDLTMFFKCLLHLCSLTFWTGLFLIYLRQHRTQRTTVHSSACFILKTTIVEIEKWTLKLIRLVETSSQPFSLFVNSQLFIHASHLSFIVHFLIMHSFLLWFKQDRAHEYRTQSLHYFLFHMLNQAPRPFPDFIQQFALGPTRLWWLCWQTLNVLMIRVNMLWNIFSYHV
jgi:hypothetical protein